MRYDQSDSFPAPNFTRTAAPLPTRATTRSRSKKRPLDNIEWDQEVIGLGFRTRGQTGDASWHVQWRVHGRTQRRSLGPVHKLSREKARMLARELIGRADVGTHAAPLLCEFVPTFFADCAARWKPYTRTVVGRMCRIHIVPELGDRGLADITRSEVLVWLDGRRTCSNWALSTLSSLMKHAEDLGHRPQNTNPCAGLRRKKSGFKAHYPDADAYRRLGDAIRKLPARSQSSGDVLRFLALTGVRRGEALGLRWDFIHGDRAVLPDSKTGPKTIWLPETAKCLLARQPRVDGSPYIFGGPDRARTLRQVNATWQAIREQAGATKLRLHDLRHGYASVAVQQDVELKTIAALLGHSDFETTMGYAHLRQQHLAKAAQRVSNSLSRAIHP